MSVNAATTSSTQVSSTSASSQASTQVNTDNAKKSSSESSFKDEMNKVSTKEQASSEKNTSEASEKKEAVNSSVEKTQNEQGSDTDLVFEGCADYSKYASMAVLDANSMLTNDIRQVMGLGAVSVEETDNLLNTKGFMTLDFTQSLSVSESDANFFLELTKNNDITSILLLSYGKLQFSVCCFPFCFLYLFQRFCTAKQDFFFFILVQKF